MTIGEAAKVLGVTTTTLRNWDRKGLLKPDELTRGGNRRYRLESLKNIKDDLHMVQDGLKTIAYARVHLTTKRKTLYAKLLSLNPTVPRKGLNMK